MTVWNTTATVPYSRNTRRTFAMFHLVDSTTFSAPALPSELLVDSHALEIISGWWGNEEITWSEEVTTCWSSCLHCANELREFVKSMQYDLVQTSVRFLVLQAGLWAHHALRTVLALFGRVGVKMGVASQNWRRDTSAEGHARSEIRYWRRHSLGTERIVDGSSNTVRVESCFWYRTR